MDIKQFKTIWEAFSSFYGHIAQGKQSVYFEAFEYLPATVVEEMFKQAKKQYTLMPSVAQLEQIRDAVVTKRGHSETRPGEKPEPAIPGVIRASNAVFANMIIGAHYDRVKRGESYLLEHWPAAFAKFWDSRKRLEHESDCVRYWQLGDKAFVATLRTINPHMWPMVKAQYEPNANPGADDVPF